MMRGAFRLTRRSSPYVASAGVGYSAYWLSEQEESVSQMMPVLYSQTAAAVMSICQKNELSHLSVVAKVAQKLKVDSERLQKFRLKREAINAEEGNVEMDEKSLVRVREIINNFKTWSPEDIANLSVVCAMTPFVEGDDVHACNTHYERELSGRMLKLATLKFADHLAETEKVRNQTVGEYYGMVGPQNGCCWKRMLCWGSAPSSNEESKNTEDCTSCPFYSAPCRMMSWTKTMIFGKAEEVCAEERKCKRASIKTNVKNVKMPVQVSAVEREDIEMNLRIGWEKHSEGSGTSMIQMEFTPVEYGQEKKRLAVLAPATQAIIKKSVNKGHAKMRANYVSKSTYICPFACSFTREHPVATAAVSSVLLCAVGGGSYYAVMALLPANFNIYDYNLFKPEYLRVVRDKSVGLVVAGYDVCLKKPTSYIIRISTPPARKVAEYTCKGASATKDVTVKVCKWSVDKVLRRKSEEKVEFSNSGAQSPAISNESFTKVEFPTM